MRDQKYYPITLALAGMMQAAGLVVELSQTGKYDEDAFQTSMHSIFQSNPRDVIDVFGNLNSIQYGLKTLIKIFSETENPSLEARYLISMIHLQKKISNSTSTLNKLDERLKQAQKQVEYFSLTHPTVIANLVDIYLSSISTFKYRIIVWGNQRILSAQDNMNKIRALLLAGIRSSVLWRQVGGSRWQLLFSRAKIKKMAEMILSEHHS